MVAIANTERIPSNDLSLQALKVSAGFWFILMTLGQWIFVYYVAMFYGSTAIQGNFEAWSEAGPQGIILGDPVGNLAMAVHVFLAIIIMFGGPLQLIPYIRRHFPRFHRWNGRVWLVTSVLVSIAGIYMTWTRGTVGSFVQHLGTTLDGVLILLFAGLALQAAVNRKFANHRRWALRLFMAVSGVWFFRVGLMAWMIINQGPVGFDPQSFTGPFLNVLAFAQYLIPLALLELYFYGQKTSSQLQRGSIAVVLLLATLVMVVGIFGAANIMWLPRIA